VSDGAHFVSVEKNGDGYKIYNPGDLYFARSKSITEYLNNRNAIPVILYSIRKGKKK